MYILSKIKTELKTGLNMKFINLSLIYKIVLRIIISARKHPSWNIKTFLILKYWLACRHSVFDTIHTLVFLFRWYHSRSHLT